MATRHDLDPWTCTSYDGRGRPTTTTIPAIGTNPARTIAYNYMVAANPAVTSLADTAGTVTTTTDWDGRTTVYTDTWGDNTTTSYDQAGRVTTTSGPAGTQTTGYDSANRPATQGLGGAVIATAGYDAASSVLTAVSYPTGSGNTANGTSLSIGRDNRGRTNALSATLPGGATLTADATTTSPAGRVATETVDNNTANPSSFVYDNLARLTTANLPGHSYTYTYANNTACPAGSLANAGANTTDRIIERDETIAGTTTAVRLGYSATGDTPDLTLDATNTVVERTLSLLGGVTVTKRASPTTDVWSYPNLHGDVAATCDGNGTKTGGTYTYDPYGQALNSLPDNSAGNYDNGWLGQHQRGTDHTGAFPIVEMGARLYTPGLGRFLQVDPIPGGSANNYDYAYQDPIKNSDLSGNCVEDACVVEGIVVETIVLHLLFGHHKHKSADPRKLPRRGPYPYVPPKEKGNPAFKRVRGGGFIDEDGSIWKWDKSHGDHWDVTFRGGGHINVFPDGRVRGEDPPGVMIGRRRNYD